MATAKWNGTVIAQSDDTVIVEGNHYFPLSSVVPGTLLDSPTTTVCPWKGTATYFSVVVDEEVNVDAAFSYLEPEEAASNIAGRVAFWRGVSVTV